MEIVSGDVRDPNGVRSAVKGCDAVLHLAALIAIPYSYESPDTHVDTNIKGTLNVLQAARDLNIQRVVHTSTSEVYDTARFVPITEDHPLQGQSPYSASKIGADQMALSFYRSFGTPVAVLRPFNTYGPRQSGRAFIPTVITQLAAGMKPLKLGALHPTRDFSFVEDTAAAFEAVLNCDAAVGQVLNAGSGFEISMGDTVACIAEAMGVAAEISCDPHACDPLSAKRNACGPTQTCCAILRVGTRNMADERALCGGYTKLLTGFCRTTICEDIGRVSTYAGFMARKVHRI